MFTITGSTTSGCTCLLSLCRRCAARYTQSGDRQYSNEKAESASASGYGELDVIHALSEISQFGLPVGQFGVRLAADRLKLFNARGRRPWMKTGIGRKSVNSIGRRSWGRDWRPGGSSSVQIRTRDTNWRCSYNLNQKPRSGSVLSSQGTALTL